MAQNFRPITQSSFDRGVWTGVSRFQQPRGTVRRISNLVLRNRSSLETVEGWSAISSDSLSASGRWLDFRHFAPAGGTAKTLGLLLGATATALYDVSGATYGAALASVAGASFANSQLVSFANQIAIALGNAVAPRLWNGTTLSTVTNTWTLASEVPVWRSGAYTACMFLRPTVDNGHIYQVVQGGETATTEPIFPTATNARVVNGSVVFEEAGPSAPPPPPGAETLVSHLGSLWAWNTSPTYTGQLDGPDALAMSDVDTAISWNPLNKLFLGKGDGTQGQGAAVMAVAEQGIASSPRLVLFKDFTTYEVMGSLPFASITQAQTDLGCIASRSIQFMALLAGIIRFTHKGFAIYRGAQAGADTHEISEPIRDYIFGSSDIAAVDFTRASLGRSAQVQDPPMYLCLMPVVGGELTRVFALDVIQKGWVIFDFPHKVGTIATNTQAGIAPRVLVGDDGASPVVRRWFAGDPDWSGIPITASVRFGQVFASPTQPVYYRRVNVRADELGPADVMSARFLYDSIQGGAERTLSLRASAALPASFPINLTGTNGGLEIVTQGRVRYEAIEWHVVLKPLQQIAVA